MLSNPHRGNFKWQKCLMKDGHQLEFPSHLQDFTWRRLNWLASLPYFLSSSLPHSLGHCPPFTTIIAGKFPAKSTKGDIGETPQNPSWGKTPKPKTLFNSIKCVPHWFKTIEEQQWMPGFTHSPLPLWCWPTGAELHLFHSVPAPWSSKMWGFSQHGEEVFCPFRPQMSMRWETLCPSCPHPLHSHSPVFKSIYG